MAKKPTLTTLSSGFNSTTTLNNNFTALRNAFDNTLSLDGSTPNAMNADLDMNSNDILNVGEIDVQALTVDGIAMYPGNAQIATTYASQNYTGNGSTTIYSMGFNPGVKANVAAYIDGVYQNQDAFSISGTNLTFTAAPPLNSAIEIKVPVNVTSLTNTNASSLVYTQGGTGSVTRSVENRLRDYVSVKDFGAVGDGVTNDHTAFQTAINSTATTVFVPDGTYKINSSLTLKSDLAIQISPNAVLDFSSAGSVMYLTASGTSAASIPVTSDVVAFGTTIQVGSTATLSVGDMLRLSSDAIFDPNRTSTQIAELVYVKSLTSTTITTTTPIQDNYTIVDNAKIEKITPVKNIFLSGGQIVGSTASASADYGLRVFFGENIVVENVYFYNIDAAMVSFVNCVGAWAKGCKFELGFSNLAYGVSFADCTRDSGCVNSIFRDVRHSLSTNNSSGAAGGIVRRILFANNIVYDSATSLAGAGGDAIDTHAAAEAISIIGNKCFGSSGQGINVECQSAQIVGNEITDSFSNGINITNHTSRIGQYRISDNIVIRAGGVGVRVDTQASDAAINSVVISSNIIQDNTSATSAIVVNNNITDQDISNVVVNGNSIRNAQSTSASISLLAVSNASVTGNTIELATNGPAGIRVDSTINTAIGNNSVSLVSGSSTSSGINIVAATAGASKNVVVTGNTVNSPSAAGSRGISISSNALGVVLSGNNFQDCTTPISGGVNYTISSDQIALVGNVGAIAVDTEGAAATDDLSTISGGIQNQILVVRTTSSARDVTLKDGVGNLRLAGDFTLTHTDDTIALTFVGGIWYELSRSDNAA